MRHVIFCEAIAPYHEVTNRVVTRFLLARAQSPALCNYRRVHRNACGELLTAEPLKRNWLGLLGLRFVNEIPQLSRSGQLRGNAVSVQSPVHEYIDQNREDLPVEPSIVPEPHNRGAAVVIGQQTWERVPERFVGDRVPLADGLERGSLVVASAQASGGPKMRRALQLTTGQPVASQAS